MKILIYILLLIFNFSLLHSKPIIVATSQPVAEIVKEIAGSNIKVVTLLNPGQLPNEHDLSPSDIFNSNSALAIVYSSDQNEDWVLDIPATKINLSDFIPVEDKIYDKDSNLVDYFWMDPITTKSVAEKLADTLGLIDPELAGDLKTNAASFGDRCDFLNNIIKTKLTSCDIKPVYSDLNTIAYFNKRYNMDGGIGFYESFQVTSEKLHERFETELIASTTGIIFYNDQLGDSIPGFLKGKLKVEIYPINFFGDDDHKRYYDIITYNLNIIVEAFQK